MELFKYEIKTCKTCSHYHSSTTRDDFSKCLLSGVGTFGLHDACKDWLSFEEYEEYKMTNKIANRSW